MRNMQTRMGEYWYGCLKAVVLLLILLFATKGHAAIVEVIGSGGESGETFLRALAKSLGPSHEVVTEISQKPSDIVIALHEGALQEARRTGAPLLVVLPESGRVELGKNESALYWAPSWIDQLRLAKQIFPSLRRVGLLLDDPRQQTRVLVLREQAKAMGLELVVKEANTDFLVRSVAELAGVCDVIIAPADSRLFTRTTIKPVLLAAYRQNRVFIGPNPAVVRAGALASLYVTPEALAAEVADRIRRQSASGSWGGTSRINRFEVTTNPQVARALGLHLPDADQLTRLLGAEGGAP